jgi:hypothetical protein
MVLYNTLGIAKSMTVIDASDVDSIKDFKWHLTGNGYVKSDSIQKMLHRYVVKALPNEQVDHIDGNPLNNTKANLRICHQMQNTWNSRMPSNNTSGVKGVSFSKVANKWHAYITYSKKRINIGHFASKEDAIAARKVAEETYFGNYRRR